MKTIQNNIGWIKWMYLWFISLLYLNSYSQTATVATPMSIGRNCGTGNAVTDASDSFKILNYGDATNQLTNVYTCWPSLAFPGYSPYAGSIAFNPQDQMIYYIETTNGVNSYIFRWAPNTCPTGSLAPAYSYNNTYIVGLDFNPLTGDGYQLEFNGASPPYTISLRKVNFGAGTFGPSDPLILPAGHQINQQSGDIVFTPTGQLYFAFDNKMFQVDYSNYGVGQSLNTTFIGDLAVGNTLLGLAYVQGKFIASMQDAGNTSCQFKEIDISSGSPVISSVTPPAGFVFTGTDMASMITGIGSAKRVTSAGPLGGNIWGIQYDIKIKNYGNTDMNFVQLTDNVKNVFGAYFTSASVAAVGTLPAGIALNPSFDGNGNSNIFAGGAGSILRATPPDSAIVRVSVFLNNPPLNTTFYNSSIATGQSILFSKSVLDSSNNDPSLRPDPNGNSVPDDPGEGLATPFKLSDWVFLANKIIDFNAHYFSNSVHIDWKLADVINYQSFFIERSSDGINYVTIGSVSANASGLKDYSWIDGQPGKDKNYYRLQVRLNDGSSFYSDVVLISLTGLKPELLVSSNPFSGPLYFNVMLKLAETVNIHLYSMDSRDVYHTERICQPGANAFQVGNLTSLPAGMYLLKVTAGRYNLSKIIIKK